MSTTTYDPYTRDDESEEKRSRAAREEHERWSLEQSRQGRSAAQRDGQGVWLPKPRENQP